jgi:hypothetical protein
MGWCARWEKHSWGLLLPAQPVMPARRPRCACASVQWLTLSDAGAGLERSHTVPMGVSCSHGTPLTSSDDPTQCRYSSTVIPNAIKGRRWWRQEPRNIFQHRITWNIKPNVRRHQPRKAEQFCSRYRLSPGERVRGSSKVFRASAGWTEKDNVDLAFTPGRR